MTPARAYDEVIDFLAGGASSQDIVDYRPSEESRERVRDLVAREKAGSLSSDEAVELQNYLQLEHIMRLAKARARAKIEARRRPS